MIQIKLEPKESTETAETVRKKQIIKEFPKRCIGKCREVYYDVVDKFEDLPEGKQNAIIYGGSAVVGIVSGIVLRKTTKLMVADEVGKAMNEYNGSTIHEKMLDTTDGLSIIRNVSYDRKGQAVSVGEFIVDKRHN